MQVLQLLWVLQMLQAPEPEPQPEPEPALACRLTSFAASQCQQAFFRDHLFLGTPHRPGVQM